MNKTILFFFFLFISFKCFAQPEYIMEYFKSNINNLDPIEGIYDVVATVSQNNTGQVERSSQNIIIKKKNDNTFAIYTFDSGQYSGIDIVKDGTSRFYVFKKSFDYEEIKNNIYLDSNNKFIYQYRIPRSQIIADAGRAFADVRVIIRWECSKTYPTSK